MRRVTMIDMNTRVARVLAAVAAYTALAGVAVAPVADAARVGQTIVVTAKQAYVDNKAPGRYWTGTIHRGDSFRVDRVRRVTHGAVKGLWYHGDVLSGDGGGTVKRHVVVTGWIKATAFS
jgi:hypothetical protein